MARSSPLLFRTLQSWQITLVSDVSTKDQVFSSTAAHTGRNGELPWHKSGDVEE
jgi:hypothetical protein